MDETAVDRGRIRDVIENWVLFRDAGDWQRFRSVWHDDGWMTATWFQGPATEFIEASQRGFEAGMNILHFLGGFTADVRGSRAIAQTKMTIRQRAPLDGVVVDATCIGRFYDFLERRDETWAIVRRQPIYEIDRLDPVDPASTVELDDRLLRQLPEGYRHLGYLQRQHGHHIHPALPGLRGPQVGLLYEEGAQWLRGSPTAGVPL